MQGGYSILNSQQSQSTTQRSFTPTSYRNNKYVPPQVLQSPHQRNTTAMIINGTGNNIQNNSNNLGQNNSFSRVAGLQTDNNLTANRQMIQKQYRQQQQAQLGQQSTTATSMNNISQAGATIALQGGPTSSSSSSSSQNVRNHSFENKENTQQQYPQVPILLQYQSHKLTNPNQNPNNTTTNQTAGTTSFPPTIAVQFPVPPQPPFPTIANHLNVTPQYSKEYQSQQHNQSNQLAQQQQRQQLQQQQQQFSPYAQQQQFQQIQQRELTSPQTQLSGRFSHDQLKSYVEEQMEELKQELTQNFQLVVQDCLNSTKAVNTQIENLKRQVGTSKLGISEANQRIEELAFAIQETNSRESLRQQQEQQQGQQDQFSDDYLTEKSNNQLKQLYSSRLAEIEQNQKDVKASLDKLKEQLVKEVSEQMDMISCQISEKVQLNEENIQANIQELRIESENKLGQICNEQAAKINEIEEAVAQMREGNVTKLVQAYQQEMNNKLNSSVNDFEQELMKLKAQLDGKLNQNQLGQVVSGYRGIKEAEIMERIGQQVDELRETVESTQLNVNESQQKIEKELGIIQRDLDGKLLEYQQTQVSQQLVFQEQIMKRLNTDGGLVKQLEESVGNLDKQVDKVSRLAENMLKNDVKLIQEQQKEQANKQTELDQQLQMIEQEFAKLQGEFNAFQQSQEQDFDGQIEKQQKTYTNTQKLGQNQGNNGFQNNILLQQQQLQSVQLNEQMIQMYPERSPKMRSEQQPSLKQEDKQQTQIGNQFKPTGESSQSNGQQQQSFSTMPLTSPYANIYHLQSQNQLQPSQNSLESGTPAISVQQQQKQQLLQLQQQQQVLRKQQEQYASIQAQEKPTIHSVGSCSNSSEMLGQEQSTSVGLNSKHARDSSTKMDEYLKQYDDFSNQVSDYIATSEQQAQQNQNTNDSKVRDSQQYAFLHNSGRFMSSEIKDQKQGQFMDSEIKDKNDGEEEVVYELDEKGYLIDDRGNYILDDEGQPIQLSPEHIEYLKTNNMLSEDSSSKISQKE